MRLFALFLAMFFATAASAGDWTKLNGDACSAVSLRAAGGQCCVALIESDLTDLSPLNVRGHVIQIRMNSGATVDLYVGDSNDTVSTASPYRWDSDGDGIPDNQELDGTTAAKVGLQSVSIAGHLIVDPTSHTSDAQLWVCAVNQ